MNPLFQLSALVLIAALALACARGPKGDQVFLSQIALERNVSLAGPESTPTVATIDRLREERRLDEARGLALFLVERDSNNPDLLWRAARSLADTALAHPQETARAEAALEGLSFARRAAELAPNDPDAQAQLAFLLGITTHLQPMKARSGHARATIAVAERTLELRPSDPLALQTLGVVHLRLSTLPWIANLMARDVPESSLATAEDFLRRALEQEPSQANHLMLAKVLLAEGQTEEAVSLLRSASTQPNAHPRDLIYRPQILALLEENS